uniref:pilus assembly protein HicB n=1 Tax=uncultured Sphingomonas sp. TaxID=158754 RepID=UPI0035CBAEFF
MTNYPLRLPDHIMAEAKHLAEANGTSLNQFLSTLIAERVGELKAMTTVRARVARADPAAAMAILSQVPDRIPLPGDELPA